jgi:hypothetical protein
MCSDFPRTPNPVFDFLVDVAPGQAQLLMFYRRAGLTLTQSWNTVNALDTKIELNDTITKGLKAELLTNFLPATSAKGAKLNLHFKQANFHGRAFFDLLKGPTANVDAVIGQDGFLAGASAGYNVQKASITGYSAAIGYAAPQYTASITATNNLSVFSAAYYHKVNSQVEAGSKATWDSKAGSSVGLEVAAKYRLDTLSFAKVSRFCQSQELILTLFIGQDQRPWCCRYCLQRSPPTRCYPWHWSLLRYPEARPSQPQDWYFSYFRGIEHFSTMTSEYDRARKLHLISSRVALHWGRMACSIETLN